MNKKVDYSKEFLLTIIDVTLLYVIIMGNKFLSIVFQIDFGIYKGIIDIAIFILLFMLPCIYGFKYLSNIREEKEITNGLKIYERYKLLYMFPSSVLLVYQAVPMSASVGFNKYNTKVLPAMLIAIITIYIYKLLVAAVMEKVYSKEDILARLLLTIISMFIITIVITWITFPIVFECIKISDF
ncbi:MAG: hypothetical protein N4A47_02115 [Clostridia bacterium]|jgi:hypothetical protein|nr:hypothetical protein [Clostridia bacterium]